MTMHVQLLQMQTIGLLYSRVHVGNLPRDSKLNSSSFESLISLLDELDMFQCKSFFLTSFTAIIYIADCMYLVELKQI